MGLRCVEESFEVSDVRMNASVRQQSKEMYFFMILPGIIEGPDQYFFFGDRSISHGIVYLDKILVYDASGTQVHMAHFGIAHLSSRQAHGFARGID